MSWTWVAQSIRRVVRDGGIVGKVAALYIAAGYNVKLNYETPVGKLGFLARKRGEAIAVDVYSSIKDVSEDSLRSLVEKAKHANAKPVLVIYGSLRIPRELAELARKFNVKLKRVKPYSKIKPH